MRVSFNPAYTAPKNVNNSPKYNPSFSKLIYDKKAILNADCFTAKEKRQTLQMLKKIKPEIDKITKPQRERRYEINVAVSPGDGGKRNYLWVELTPNGPSAEKALRWYFTDELSTTTIVEDTKNYIDIMEANDKLRGLS